MMIWGCMNAKGVGKIIFIYTIHVYGYTRILADKMTPTLQKLGRRGIFQHDSDTHRHKTEFVKKAKVKTMTWPSKFIT